MNICRRCGVKIAEQETRLVKEEILCEDCFMEEQIPYSRKTHWQYIGSIKTEYLLPEKKETR